MLMRHAKAVGRNVLLRHGTVAAYLALMLASSTAAYAAATIGSAQVIDNSLKSVDLANGAAVGGVDVINDSLMGADVQEASLNGVARAIDYHEVGDPVAGPMKKVATAGGYDLLADCWTYYHPSSGYVPLRLWLRGPAGAVQWQYSHWTNDDGSGLFSSPGGKALPSGVATHIREDIAFSKNYVRAVGDFTIVSGTTLVKFDLHILIDARSDPGSCSIFGTVLKAA